MNAQIVIIFAISICAALAAPTERPDADYDPSLDGDYNYEGYQYDLTADQYACMNAPELTLGIDALCNGRADCPERDDELPEICELYGREAPSSSQAVTSTPTPETPAASLAPLAASSTESDYPEYEDTCMSDEFMCPSDYICIPKIALCDGESDCSGSEDEQNCGPRTVRPNLIRPPFSFHHINRDNNIEPPTRDLRMPEPEFEHPDAAFRIPKKIPAVSKAPSSFDVISHNRRPVHRASPPPPAVAVEMPTPAAPARHQNAGFNAVHRFRPMPDLAPKFVGESGETAPEASVASSLHELPPMEHLSDSQAEQMLQSLALGGAQQPSINSQALKSNQIPSELPVVKSTKSSAVYKARFKGLLGQMIKQMSKMVAADLDNRDIALSVKIGGNKGDAAAQGGVAAEPKMTLSLEVEI